VARYEELAGAFFAQKLHVRSPVGSSIPRARAVAIVATRPAPTHPRQIAAFPDDVTTSFDGKTAPQKAQCTSRIVSEELDEALTRASYASTRRRVYTVGVRISDRAGTRLRGLAA
jgi:hypothetical protein